jgi:hypothetical protein
VISLKLIWFNRSHPFESDILCNYYFTPIFFSIMKKIKYGLEPGWLGASFGLRICYVRIIIIRNIITYLIVNGNVNKIIVISINIFLYY